MKLYQFVIKKLLFLRRQSDRRS